MQTALARSEQRPFPLPQDISATLARSVSRAATATVLREIGWPNNGSAEDILRKAWPGDGRALAILQRAATAPATTTTAGWAAELAVIGTVDAFFQNLQQSAAARLFAACLRLPLDGYGSIKVPFAAATPSLSPSFVQEGAPIPVRQAAINATVSLASRKMAVLTALTNDLADHSTPVAEVIIRQVLTANAAVALDQAFFSAAAGDATRPPGILNGVSGQTPTTGGGAAALLGDLKGLSAALAAAGAGSRIMLFVPPAQAAAIPVYAPGYNTSVEIIPTPALAATSTVVAIDPNGVVSGYSGEPEITVGRETTVHLEDTTPLQIASGPQGSAVLATPTRSMFQTDSFGLRLLLPCGWAARPGFVQFVSAVTW